MRNYEFTKEGEIVLVGLGNWPTGRGHYWAKVVKGEVEINFIKGVETNDMAKEVGCQWIKNIISTNILKPAYEYYDVNGVCLHRETNYFRSVNLSAGVIPNTGGKTMYDLYYDMVVGGGKQGEILYWNCVNAELTKAGFAPCFDANGNFKIPIFLKTEVVADEMPEPEPETEPDPQTYTLTVNVTDGGGTYTYKLQKDTEPAVTQALNEFTNLTAGTYKLTVTSPNSMPCILTLTI